MVSSSLFLSIIDTWARSHNRDTGTMLTDVLDEWFTSMDGVSAPAKKKLLCMALTKLLETGQPWILSRLQELMALWTGMSAEVRDEYKGKLSDTLVYEPGLEADGVEGMDVPEEVRKRRSACEDVVHTVNVNEFVRYVWTKHVSLR